MLWLTATAQKTVSGTVEDRSGEPLIGARVIVKGTSNGDITDIDGKFRLTNVPYTADLTFTYIGFQAKTVGTTPNDSIYHIILQAQLLRNY